MNIAEIITDGKSRVKGFEVVGQWSEYTDVNYNVKLWYKFWTKIYKGAKSDPVLDFGAGSTWGGFVAERLGYKSHFNLDIDNADVKRVFGDYANLLGQKVMYYDGKVLPYNQNFFSNIVAKASIMKLVSADFRSLVYELVRVSRPGGTLYIASKGMCYRFKERLLEEGLDHIFQQKQLKIRCWSWNILERNRSKTILTEFYILYKINKLIRKFIASEG